MGQPNAPASPNLLARKGEASPTTSNGWTGVADWGPVTDVAATFMKTRKARAVETLADILAEPGPPATAPPRPSNAPRRPVTVRLTADQFRRLRLASALRDTSMQRVLAQALEVYLRAATAGYPDCRCLQPNPAAMTKSSDPKRCGLSCAAKKRPAPESAASTRASSARSRTP